MVSTKQTLYRTGVRFLSPLTGASTAIQHGQLAVTLILLVGLTGAGEVLIQTATAAVPQGVGAFAGLFFASTVLALFALEGAQRELDLKDALPRPQIRFEKTNPSESAVGWTRTVVQESGETLSIQNDTMTSLATFARAECSNAGGDIPAQTLERPMVRIVYSTMAGKTVAIVNEARIAGTDERFDSRSADPSIKTARDVRLNEIRVGERFVIDLLMRYSHEAVAHTWSNGDPTVGEEDFLPGRYHASIEFYGDNLPGGQVVRLCVDIPADPEATMEILQDNE